MSSEKTSLIDLFKRNKKEKLFPIIFLTTFHSNAKLITEIKKQGCSEIKYNKLTDLDLKKLINKICKKEHMIINDEKVIKK